MWINELNTGVEEMKREAEDIARNYEDLSDYQITTRVFVSCINEIALDSSVWLVDRNGLQLNVTGLDASTPDLTSEDVQKYMQVVLQSGEPMTIQGGFDSYFGKNAVITVAMPLSSRGRRWAPCSSTSGWSSSTRGLCPCSRSCGRRPCWRACWA